MKSNPNLILAWLWILLGFVSGMMLGMFFHGENWLGGYGSFKRRMYRLGHISFFGLGAVNLLFWLTVQNFLLTGALGAGFSWLRSVSRAIRNSTRVTAPGKGAITAASSRLRGQG